MSRIKTKNFFRNAEVQRRAPAPTAVSFSSLLDKSRLLAKRGLASKATGDITEYQLWAAFSLEILAKAQLAGIHPTLVAESDNPNSLLEACGISTDTAVKTISASVAYARLRHTVTGFTTVVQAECRKLSERRNAELHSGDAACASLPLQAWEGDFWNAAEIILESMDMDLARWLGADSTLPAHLLEGYRAAKKEAAIQRIKQFGDTFSQTPEGKAKGRKREEYLMRSPALLTPAYAGQQAMRYIYNRYWTHGCPACQCWAVVGGDLNWSESADDQSDAEPGEELIDKEFSSEELYCPSCKLSLVGVEALEAGNVPEVMEETVAEEISYEPEYGND